MLVSTLTLIAVKQGWVEGGPIQLMVPCLFFFIPGDAISAGLLELADGRITAGATRLIYSVAILLVLAFGALVGTVLADVPTQRAVRRRRAGHARVLGRVGRLGDLRRRDDADVLDAPGRLPVGARA